MHPLMIFTNDAMSAHQNMYDHPECPERLSVILDMIKTDMPGIPIETAYPVDDNILLLAHPQSHIDFILDKTPFDGWAMIDADTGMNAHSYDSALLSVGASLQATRAVINGESKTAFALSRPPGHHAEYDTAMGFCFFRADCAS
jgi:acetoin utilization deacetylase AcuC-like enzyme